MKTKSNMLLFYGGVFSNFYPANFCAKDVPGFVFGTSEQYFMFMKANFFGDLSMAREIVLTNDPAKAKAWGRKVRDFNQKKWDEVKYEIMYRACYYKFSQNTALRQQLLKTVGKELVEASPTDCVWGIGLAENDPNVLDKSKWRGKNLLGQVLMEVRDDLITREPQYGC